MLPDAPPSPARGELIPSPHSSPPPLSLQTGGYGTFTFSDNPVVGGFMWEVDIFQATADPFVIQLSLAAPGLPLLLNLTSASNPVQSISSFGILPYATLSDAIAASSNPSAGLSDSSM